MSRRIAPPPYHVVSYGGAVSQAVDLDALIQSSSRNEIRSERRNLLIQEAKELGAHVSRIDAHFEDILLTLARTVAGFALPTEFLELRATYEAYRAILYKAREASTNLVYSLKLFDNRFITMIKSEDDDYAIMHLQRFVKRLQRRRPLEDLEDRLGQVCSGLGSTIKNVQTSRLHDPTSTINKKRVEIDVLERNVDIIKNKLAGLIPPFLYTLGVDVNYPKYLLMPTAAVCTLTLGPGSTSQLLADINRAMDELHTAQANLQTARLDLTSLDREAGQFQASDLGDAEWRRIIDSLQNLLSELNGVIPTLMIFHRIHAMIKSDIDGYIEFLQSDSRMDAPSRARSFGALEGAGAMYAPLYRALEEFSTTV